MKLDHFSPQAQEGLRRWAEDVLLDELALDGTSTEHWAWILLLLKESQDQPDWFPKGKWATLQHLEAKLIEEARDEVRSLKEAHERAQESR
jgi:hypothetical protein